MSFERHGCYWNRDGLLSGQRAAETVRGRKRSSSAVDEEHRDVEALYLSEARSRPAQASWASHSVRRVRRRTWRSQTRPGDKRVSEVACKEQETDLVTEIDGFGHANEQANFDDTSEHLDPREELGGAIVQDLSAYGEERYIQSRDRSSPARGTVHQ
jgi:hypothetical protein